MPPFTAVVGSADRIVTAVGEHVITEGALAGTGVTVCVDETTPLGVIVAGLEVIQPGVYGNLLATGPFLAPIWAAGNCRPERAKNGPVANRVP